MDNEPTYRPPPLQPPARPVIVPVSRPGAAVMNPMQPIAAHSGLSIADVFLAPKERETPALKEILPPKETLAPPVPPALPVSAPPAPPPKRHSATPAMPSLGILDRLLADESVHDILVNGTTPIYIDRGSELEDSGLRFASDEEVWKVAETIMDTIGQRWNPDRPLIDTRLPDGSRVNIVAPPMSVDGVSISIRKFPTLRVTLDSMVTSGQLSREVAEFLKAVIAARLNIVISGGTGSGKTTLLNALSVAISRKERIVTIEDSAELRLQQPHVVRLETKPPTAVDQPDSAVTIRDLVKNALRMRPDRIIVGESRGAEAFDMLQAMNTGHDGSMTTLHANTPRDALSRLEMMVSLAMPQAPIRMVRAQIAGTLHLIIQTNRTKDGGRHITHISEIAGLEGETIIMQDLIVYREVNGQPAEYRWVAGSSRNAAITQAAQAAGLLRGR